MLLVLLSFCAVTSWAFGYYDYPEIEIGNWYGKTPAEVQQVCNEYSRSHPNFKMILHGSGASASEGWCPNVSDFEFKLDKQDRICAVRQRYVGCAYTGSSDWLESREAAVCSQDHQTQCEINSDLREMGYCGYPTSAARRARHRYQRHDYLGSFADVLRLDASALLLHSGPIRTVVHGDGW